MLTLLALTAALVAPTKLVVLQHGLYGGAVNLGVLATELERRGGGDVRVHCAADNEGCTRDGVAAGGRRLAEEVRRVAASGPSLQTLSLVGNSLGGLYCRYAAAELLDARTGLMAGLDPDAFVSIGCPHLGVRRFTYLPLAPAVQRLGWLVAGQTAEDLLLRDAADPSRALLVQMSSREGGPEARYLDALRRFRRRRLYANLVGDFMVPFGTAAAQPADTARLREGDCSTPPLPRSGSAAPTSSTV